MIQKSRGQLCSSSQGAGARAGFPQDPGRGNAIILSKYSTDKVVLLPGAPGEPTHHSDTGRRPWLNGHLRKNVLDNKKQTRLSNMSAIHTGR